MTDRELMKLALEALDWAAGCIEPLKPINCDCPVCWASNALRERLAQPEQKWVGLTEAEKVNVALACGCADVAWIDFADAIEAKLLEKNT